jgi:hypothetical protein
LLLLQDNASAPKAASVCEFLIPKKYYNPFITHCTIHIYLRQTTSFLFPKLKIKLKGPQFVDVAEIQEAVNDDLKKVQKEEFAAAI